MTELFNRCIDVILMHEGGYVNDPDDPGGETNFGIAKRSHPDIDIKNLTLEQAKQIYYDSYWLPMMLEGITDEEIVMQIFDFGVNAGIRRAVKLAQRIAGSYIDGVMGVNTIAAINAAECFVSHYKRGRIDYYYSIAKNEKAKYLKGWINRVNS